MTFGKNDDLLLWKWINRVEKLSVALRTKLLNKFTLIEAIEPSKNLKSLTGNENSPLF